MIVYLAGPNNSQLAIKYGVAYDTKWHEFHGEADAVQKATAALKQWADKEASIQFRANR